MCSSTNLNQAAGETGHEVQSPELQTGATLIAPVCLYAAKRSIVNISFNFQYSYPNSVYLGV